MSFKFRVSIPFKRERGAKDTPGGNYVRAHACFHSLQTGTRIQSGCRCFFQESHLVMFPFPSNGNADTKRIISDFHKDMLDLELFPFPSNGKAETKDKR